MNATANPTPKSFIFQLPFPVRTPLILQGNFSRFHKCDPSFYAAGKISKNGWRRCFDISMPNSWEEYVGAKPVPTRYNLSYTGPFFISCKHGCSYKTESHATVGCDGEEFRPSQVLRRSERQIQQSGFVLVWAGIGEDDLCTAYGTLVEIGIAHSLGKPILLVVHPRANLRPFWFAVETASAVVCAESALEAVELWDADRSRR